jgi:hypothetical protein
VPHTSATSSSRSMCIGWVIRLLAEIECGCVLNEGSVSIEQPENARVK